MNPQAYFAPYPLQRHAELIAEVQSLPGVNLTVLGQSLDGRDIDCLRIGRFSGRSGLGLQKTWHIDVDFVGKWPILLVHAPELAFCRFPV